MVTHLKFHKTIVLITLVFAIFATIALAMLGTVISAYAVSTDSPLPPEMLYTAFFLWILAPFLVVKLVERIKKE